MRTVYVWLLGPVISLTSAFAAVTPPALPLVEDLDLDDHRGQTFLATMIEERNGIVAEMDAAHYKVYRFPDWSNTEKALDNFDYKNKNRVLKAFSNSRKKMRKFVKQLEGQKFTMADNNDPKKASGVKNIVDLIRTKYRGRGNVYSLGHFFGMAARGGTLVVIDRNNYFYNIGYYHPEVRSGRSYSASPEHPANDVSHKKYLRDLEKFYKGNEERLFFNIVMNVLTNTDDSNFEKLSNLGESVATDFVAVYVAELRRHIMKKLHPKRNEWGNDYIEITLVSAFSSSAGKRKPILLMKVMDKNNRSVLRLQQSDMFRWWEMNYATGRSGIGKTQRERRKLQRHITNYMRIYHPQLVSAVQNITAKHRDVYQGLSEYLNNYDTPKKLGSDAKKLSKAMVEFVLRTQKDAKKIVDYIYDKEPSLKPRSGDHDWVQYTKTEQKQL